MRVAPLLLGLVLAVPSAVQAQSSAPAAPVAGKSADGEKVICKREDGVGSRLGKRVCLTRSQWADQLTQQANNRNDLLGRAEREEREPSAFGDRPL